jgi:hypothetical protein
MYLSIVSKELKTWKGKTYSTYLFIVIVLKFVYKCLNFIVIEDELEN